MLCVGVVQRWRGRGCRKFIPVLGEDGMKIAPPGYIVDRPSSVMSWIRGKFADHVGDHGVLSPEGTVLVTFPGTESYYPRPSQSLNDSLTHHMDYYLLSQLMTCNISWGSAHCWRLFAILLYITENYEQRTSQQYRALRECPKL